MRTITRPNQTLLKLYLASVKLESESVAEIEKLHHYTQDQLEVLPVGDAAFQYFSNELNRLRKAAYAQASIKNQLQECLYVNPHYGMSQDVIDLCTEYKLTYAPYRTASVQNSGMAIDISKMSNAQQEEFYEYLVLAIRHYEFCNLTTCFRN